MPDGSAILYLQEASSAPMLQFSCCGHALVRSSLQRPQLRPAIACIMQPSNEPSQARNMEDSKLDQFPHEILTLTKLDRSWLARIVVTLPATNGTAATTATATTHQGALRTPASTAATAGSSPAASSSSSPSSPLCVHETTPGIPLSGGDHLRRCLRHLTACGYGQPCSDCSRG